MKKVACQRFLLFPEAFTAPPLVFSEFKVSAVSLLVQKSLFLNKPEE